MMSKLLTRELLYTSIHSCRLLYENGTIYQKMINMQIDSFKLQISRNKTTVPFVFILEAESYKICILGYAQDAAL